LTVFITIIQGYGIAVGLEGMTGSAGLSAVVMPGFIFKFTTIVSLVGGTMFIVWLGEQITSRGVGNGSSLIITVGIIANIPSALAQTFELAKIGGITPVGLIFKGRCEFSEDIILPPIWRFGYWMVIFLCALSTRTIM
jgi:preprotein translocase subunit SecY